MDEDTIDEILYLARANEATELATYLSNLSAQTPQSQAQLVAAAADPYSKNTALHYAAANGHVGTSHPARDRLRVSGSYVLTAAHRYRKAALLSGLGQGFGACVGAYQRGKRRRQHGTALGCPQWASRVRQAAGRSRCRRHHHQQSRP